MLYQKDTKILVTKVCVIGEADFRVLLFMLYFVSSVFFVDMSFMYFVDKFFVCFMYDIHIESLTLYYLLHFF